MSLIRSLTCFCLMVFISPIQAEDCPPPPPLNITTNDIFDLDDPDTLWVHRLANNFHTVTKQFTIENELAFLNEKCGINDKDLQEVERTLRQLKYIKSAVASQNDDGEINVETTDKWTLMPTADFGRKGGVNKYSVGLKDRNLLGYGIDAEIEYYKDAQRSGYVLSSHFPLYTSNNVYGSLTLSDTDDGSMQAASILKPFISFDTTTAWSANIYRSDLSQQYFLNGSDYYELNFSDRDLQLSWGKKWWRDEDSVIRYKLGVDYTQRTFNSISSVYNINLPPDREYLVPFIQLEYAEDNFKTLTNIHVINQIEDFNFGWHFVSKLGMNVASRDNDEARYLMSLAASKGTQLSESAMLLSRISYEYDVGGTSVPRSVLTMENELFFKVSPKFGLYGAQRLSHTKNQYADLPVVIGEETGVRGYPLEFQRGTTAASFTGELRYYPDISIYDLFDVGAAAFVDAGRVYGTKGFDNEYSQWLTSFGVGARFYSRHASDTQVIHVDVSFPTLSDDNVDNVAFLITSKTSF